MKYSLYLINIYTYFTIYILSISILAICILILMKPVFIRFIHDRYDMSDINLLFIHIDVQIYR